jgi:hypothetical protein
MKKNKEKIQNTLMLFVFILGSLMLFGDFNKNTQEELTVDQLADQQKEFFVSDEFNNNKEKYIPNYGEAQKEREYLDNRMKVN